MASELYGSSIREAALAEDMNNSENGAGKPFDADPAGEQETLRTRNQELAAYAHTVAHNLKDPLSVIMATSDAIFHISDLTQEELRAYLMQIHSTAQAMDNMIDNILLLSELDEVEAPNAPVNMGEIVERVRMRLAHLIKQHRARIQHPETWPVIQGYAPWVEEVWANFLSNAIKYGGRPPQVELGATAQPDDRVMFWVRDNGAGLSSETRTSLFKPFAQFGPVRTPGHGLGLQIAKRIVEKLGGEVGVESEAGRGSLFFFTLPAQP